MNNETSISKIIREAKARYCRFIDTKEWEKFSGLFARKPKIRFLNVSGTVLAEFDSVDDFVAVTKAYLTDAATIHQIHNEEIEIVSGSEVRAIWSMEDYIVFNGRDEGHPASSRGYGHYHETWRLEDGEWRIASIELRRAILEIKPREQAA